jgi:3-hydroxyacyl-CoA dehydrogenase
MTYKKVAVIGAGAMGQGIAQVMAPQSEEVIFVDIAADFVEKGIARIASRYASDIKKGKMSPEEKDRIMARIKGTTRQEDAAGVDLVIEAIIEDRKTKGDLFRNLDRICTKETVFATNTSTLSVTELAILSGRPGRFLGLHFFNPVHVMKLVEVIPGLDTEKEAVDIVFNAMKTIKKVPVVVQDCPGFLVNRVLLMYIGEALLAAQEGISPEEIDAGAKAAGFPMGPLELVDMVGIDVSLHTQPVLHEAYGTRFPFPELIQRLYDAGRLGMKVGKGIYNEGKVDDEFKKIVKDMNRETPPSFSIDRLILRQVNEAVYCLQEGVATAEEIDRAMVLGTAFPNNQGIGGPLHWADEKGLDWVLANLEAFVSLGSRFWPHHLLKTYVAAGRLGRKTGRGFFEYK